MKCKKCGAVYKEDVNFCTICGTAMEKSKSDTKKTVLISVAATLVVCIIGFIVWMNINSEESFDDTPDSIETYEQRHEAIYEDEYEDDSDFSTISEDEYIIADSDTRKVTRSELSYLSDWELRYAANEIYARNGRLFNDNDVQRYFLSKDWYDGTVLAEDFDEDIYLNDIERYNLKLIVQEENERGR